MRWLWLPLVAVILSISSCRVTRTFQSGETLLKQNIIKFEGSKKIENQSQLWEDLLHVAPQRPNRKSFGFIPFKLMFYTAANHGRENKTKWWFKHYVGEPPVIYDAEQADKADKLMASYLQNSGYLHADVSHDVTTNKRKRTFVKYHVKLGPTWRIGEVTMPNQPYQTDSIVREFSILCLLHKGARFDITTLKSERERIENQLRNFGYYYFTKDYVSYDLDTAQKPQTVNIKIRINQLSDSDLHETYSINKVYMTDDFGDELTGRVVHRDTFALREYRFVTARHTVRYPFLLDANFVNGGDLYSKDKQVRTIRTMSNIGAFKFVTVDYARVADQPHTLNAYINLTPAKHQILSAEGQADLNYEGFFGVGGTLSYKNRNLTRRSDLLAIDFSAGVQFQFANKQPLKVITNEFGAGISYYFNRLLFPSKKLRLYFKDKSPKTHISLKYNYESRYNISNGQRIFYYNLHSIGTSFGYEWTQNRNIRHLMNPVNFTLLLLPQTGDSFQKLLTENPILKNSYQEQIIFGPSYTFIFNNQRTKYDKRSVFFSASFETSGNLLYAGFALAHVGKTAILPYKLVGNVGFSQYFKTEFDLRSYYRINNHASLAGKSFFGIAIPFGNSTSIPFTKQFFVGGPNSLRGFRVREIGPGSSPYDTTTSHKSGFFVQTGDMKIELNGELRFDIYKWFKGALFTDIGNVWLLRSDINRPNGEFAFNRFWKEFAIDIGAGLRMDFSYFVVRIDYGIPIRNPAYNPSLANPEQKWYINPSFSGFQLAIGYPF